MKIAIAQLNATVGDLAGNVERIASFAERARRAGADLMVTPELAICGYPPEDLLLRPDFLLACERALAELAARVKGVTLVVGHPRVASGKRYNSASILQDGKVAGVYDKQRLPNYTVFDEERYFEPGGAPCVFGMNGVNFGVNICEDTWGAQAVTDVRSRDARLGINICADSWHADAPRAARAAGAGVLLVLNASPYHMKKQHLRQDVMRRRVEETGLALVYANLVGGQDELVFDGGSFVLNREGKVTHQLPLFEEALGLVTLTDGDPQPGEIAAPLALEEEVYRALITGVRDYVEKNGFPGVLIGVSGGVDSALTLAIAVDALGAERVRAVMMPSQYTADISVQDAREEARALGVRYTEIAIKPIFDAFLKALAAEFEGLAPDVTEENLQSRIRGTLLMALSNKTGALVLTTGNKSEMGTGYATLYGDMAGGFGVLKDINKTMVYRLANYRNRISRVIPQRVIERAPSAELRPNQTDQDSLPPYPVLDAIMEAYVENDLAPEEIVAQGYAPADVERVVGLVRASEYKRRQAPIGIRITPRGFGKDWRYPITNKYRHRSG
ncbi:MAG TPA: NAD+ synthase [Burkholderiales bacterium]|nr:NAD+ synthase [Burkholderiales bacterium]